MWHSRAGSLAGLIEISVNWSINSRKTIINMKIQKSVTFSGCSVRLFIQNLSMIVLFRPEVPSRKQATGYKLL